MKFWLATAFLTNIAGIISITDRFMLWSNSFNSVLTYYIQGRDLILEPLRSFSGLNIPSWTADALVVWIGFFFTWNIISLSVHGKGIRGTLRSYEFNWLSSYILTFTTFLTGPFFPLLMRRIIKLGDKLNGYDNEETKTVFGGITSAIVFESFAYLLLVMSLLSMLFIVHARWIAA